MLKLNFKYLALAGLLCACFQAMAQQVTFIRNKGQWQNNIFFKADIPGGDLFVTRQGLVYSLYDEHALHENQHNGKDTVVMGQAIFLNLIGAQAGVTAEGYHYLPTAYNYFTGNDRSRWVSNARACTEVVLREVYPGIDFRVTGVDGGVKTSFIVKKGGDKNKILLQYEGAGNITIEQESLVVSHLFGQIRELPPVSFVTRSVITEECPTRYVLADGMVSYDVMLAKSLKQADSLIIDPSIVFSTFSGSVADNFGFTATFDKDGHAYGGGTVYSVGFPTRAGVYQLSFSGGPGGSSSGGRDVGILKFSPDGRQLLYATYLGGSNNEQPHSMSCDAGGNLFVMGTTRSADFPVKNGYDLSHNGAYDLFVACLRPDGSDLLSSTFIGGTGVDGINGEERRLSLYPTNYNYGDAYRGDIRLDASGNVYIASVTQSNSTAQGLPMVNATQAAFGGVQDGWVLKLSHSLGQLLFSSYVGGTGVDAAYAVRITDNSFYIAGGTTSADLPQAPASGSFGFHGNADGFIARFTQAGSAITHQKTICLGSSSYDQNYFITTDRQKRVYVAGQSAGSVPRTGNVFYESGGKQYITVLDEDLQTILLQTAFGLGSFPQLSPSAFMVDKCDRVYLSGWGGMSNRNYNNATSMLSAMPVTGDAFQSSTDGSDFYLVIFNKDLVSVGYATYFGGPRSQEHVDGGTSHFDENGAVYQSVCAGCGGFSDFPTTPDAYSRTNNGRRPFDPTIGGCNNAVFKFDARPNPILPVMRDTVITITVSDTADFTFDITDANGDSIVIDDILSPLFLLPLNPPQVSILTNRPGFIRASLTWITNCNTRADTFYIRVRFREISCESSAQVEGVIKIIVQQTPVAFVDLNCLRQVGTNGFEISWSNPAFHKYLQRIEIYRSVNNGPFDSLYSVFSPVTIPGISDVVSNPGTDNYCYRITGVNTCGVKSHFSRQSCSLEGDTISPGAYRFSNDTIWYVLPADTLKAVLTVADNAFNDSMYLNYNGRLASMAGARVSHLNGRGTAFINVEFIAGCSQVGDTFALNFGIRDNQCPTPLRDVGRVRVVVLPLPLAPSPDLLCLRYISNEKVGVKWPNDRHSRYTQKYAIVKRWADGRITQTGVYDMTSTAHIEQPVQNPFTEEQCFALVSINYCDLPSDTGAFTCTPWPDSLYPRGVFPHYVSVVDNRHLEVSWGTENGLASELFRVDEASAQRQLLYAATGGPDTLWTDRDEKLDVSRHSYCYLVEHISECGLRPKTPPVACSIVLKGESKPFEHTLTWTEYNYFNEGTERYDLLARDLTETDFTKKNIAYHKDTHCTDDKLNKETGVFYYQAVAFENLDGYRSYSNTVELRQKPLLHVPNAYTANGDNLNDTWNIVPVFVKEYTLRVYDRWGRTVFETSDKHRQMADRDMNNAVLPCDVYAYVISYTGFSGEVFTRTGNVTVLK